jgi:hypothetical protein
MKTTRIVILATVLLSLVAFTTVVAQTEQLALRMSRDWGYGGFNGEIQGLFSMRVTGPADLARVVFFIDEIRIGEVTQAPFNLQFNTDNYPLGRHQIYVVGYSKTGQEFQSNIISANFVPKQSSAKVILPVLGIILVAVLLSALVPFLTSRGKRASIPMGAQRHYGAGGGAICPKCHRPFSLSLFSPHFGFHKLAICPFCGKWSIVRVQSISSLRDAEHDELEGTKGDILEIPEEEKLRKDLDDSKYQGL